MKVASGRERDADDLELIAGRTTCRAIVTRFNELLPGIGNRAAVPGIADALVSYLVDHYQVSAERVIRDLAVRDDLKKDLIEARRGQQPD